MHYYFQFHLKTCKDSITGEREFFKVGGPPKPAMSVPVPNNVPCFVDNEVWGDEVGTFKIRSPSPSSIT